METQEIFNSMMEDAIRYLQDKGYITIPSTKESPEPDYKSMVDGLKELGKL